MDFSFRSHFMAPYTIILNWWIHFKEIVILTTSFYDIYQKILTNEDYFQNFSWSQFYIWYELWSVIQGQKRDHVSNSLGYQFNWCSMNSWEFWDLIFLEWNWSKNETLLPEKLNPTRGFVGGPKNDNLVNIFCFAPHCVDFGAVFFFFCCQRNSL